MGPAIAERLIKWEKNRLVKRRSTQRTNVKKHRIAALFQGLNGSFRRLNPDRLCARLLSCSRHNNPVRILQNKLCNSRKRLVGNWRHAFQREAGWRKYRPNGPENPNHGRGSGY